MNIRRGICLAALVGLLTGPSLAWAQPMTLLQAIETTLTQNDELSAKQAKLDADKEAVNQAWANVKPNVSFRYSSGYAEYSTTYLDDQDRRYNRGTLSLVQPVYSLKRFRDIDRSETSVTAAQLQFKLDEQTKVLEMVESFLELSKFIKTLKISEQELEDHVVKMKRLDAMLQRGLATKMDTLEAQSRYDELKANLVSNQNEVLVRQKRLEHLLGKPVGEVKPIEESLWQRAGAIVKKRDWHQLAWKHALSIQVAKGRYQLAQQDVTLKRAEHWPEVNLRVEAGKTDSYETSIEDERKIQLEMTVPLYQGGSTSSKVTAAKKIMQSREYQLKDQKRFVKVKLEEVLSRLNGGLANIQAWRQSVESNEAYLEAAERGLNYGLRGVYDVLEAKSRLYEAQRKLAFEVYDNLMAQFEFLYLIGRLDYASVERYLTQPFSSDSLM